MGRGRSIDLDPHRDRIARMLQGQRTQQAIRDSLKRDYGLVVSRAYFQRVIRQWGLGTRGPYVERTSALTEQIKELLSTYDITDKHTTELLNCAGFGHVPWKTVYSIRRNLGVVRQIPGEQRTEHIEGIRNILMDEFNNGRIENMGRGLLYRHLRLQYGPTMVVGRDRTYDIVRELHPEGIAQRNA